MTSEAPRRRPGPLFLQELGHFLLRHHARQQDLPLDVHTFSRRIQRRYSTGRHQPQPQPQPQPTYPTLCAAGDDALLEAMQYLADLDGVKMERLTAGPKTMTMLTWVGKTELRTLVGGWEGQAVAVEERDAPGAAADDPAHFYIPRDQPQQGQQQGHDEVQSPERKKARQAAASTAVAGSSKQTVADILGKPTALEALAAERFKKHAPVVREFCQHRTKVECEAYGRAVIGHAASPAAAASSRCMKLHFRRVIESHTDVSLGDCAYLSTCRRTRTCKFIHYEIEDEAPLSTSSSASASAATTAAATTMGGLAGGTTGHPFLEAAAGTTAGQVLQLAGPSLAPRPPAQWVNIDVRGFDLSVLGQFDVIMADPPWEIHMDLPYGTMSDDEVCKLNFPKLQEQDGGLLFLWVTGRAMERAREIFDHWGYHQLEEIVWIKTNQLQKVIRTGRTGHWLNHSKEHCLVGVKGQPRGLNRYLDSDVLVAEARETSRKPDEIYDIIERMSPGTRKIEIFGRRHNVRDGWVTVGNQLGSTRLVEPEVAARFQAWQAERPGSDHQHQRQHQHQLPTTG